jgi:hypothetical protein
MNGFSELLADPGAGEACHLVDKSGSRADQWPGQRGAGSFAEAQAEIEQRLGVRGCAVGA